MGAVPLSVPASRSGGPPTDTGSALRAASAAESGTGLGQRAASAVEAGRAADLTRVGVLPQAADSKREQFRQYLEKSGVLDMLTKGKSPVHAVPPEGPAGALRGLCGRVPLLSGCPALAEQLPPCTAVSRSSLGLPCRSPLASRLASPIAFSPQSGEAAGRRTRLENLVRRGLEMESEVRGGAVHAGRGQRAPGNVPRELQTLHSSPHLQRVGSDC